METKKEGDIQMAEKKAKGLVAKKNWHIKQNEIDLEIKKGEAIPKLPKHLLDALKTEKVI